MILKALGSFPLRYLDNTWGQEAKSPSLLRPTACAMCQGLVRVPSHMVACDPCASICKVLYDTCASMPRVGT